MIVTIEFQISAYDIGILRSRHPNDPRFEDVAIKAIFEVVQLHKDYLRCQSAAYREMEEEIQAERTLARIRSSRNSDDEPIPWGQ